MTFEQLTGIVEALAASVVARDNQLDALTNITRELSITASNHTRQIEALIIMAEKHEKTWQDLQRQWQAYINTLPKQ